MIVKTAIMVTGGIDSTLLMYQMRERNAVMISVNYGQAIWEKQRDLILFHMNQLNMDINTFVELKIQYMDWQKTEGLFKPGYTPKEKEDIHTDWDTIPHSKYFIEGRNAIMLCYALAYCSANGIDELIVGYEYEKDEWPKIRTTRLMADDTSPHFLDTMNILALSGFSNVVRIRAPFYEQRMDKKEIIKKCLEEDVDLNMTYSCYFWPGPCGKCDNCLLKKEAIESIFEDQNERK